jgi:hypothetical protein
LLARTRRIKSLIAKAALVSRLFFVGLEIIFRSESKSQREKKAHTRMLFSLIFAQIGQAGASTVLEYRSNTPMLLLVVRSLCSQ